MRIWLKILNDVLSEVKGYYDADPLIDEFTNQIRDFFLKNDKKVSLKDFRKFMMSGAAVEYQQKAKRSAWRNLIDKGQKGGPYAKLENDYWIWQS